MCLARDRWDSPACCTQEPPCSFSSRLCRLCSPPPFLSVPCLLLLCVLLLAPLCVVVRWRLMNRSNQQLSLCVWNVQGLGDPLKCVDVKQCLSEKPFSIICIQETKLPDVPKQKACSFLPAANSKFVFKPSDGSRGGILTAWNPNTLALQSSTIMAYRSVSTFRSMSNNFSFSVENVHAPADHARNQDFLAELLSLKHTIAGPLMITCDFNLTRCPADKNSPKFHCSGSRPVQRLYQ